MGSTSPLPLAGAVAPTDGPNRWPQEMAPRINITTAEAVDREFEYIEMGSTSPLPFPPTQPPTHLLPTQGLRESCGGQSWRSEAGPRGLEAAEARRTAEMGGSASGCGRQAFACGRFLGQRVRSPFRVGGGPMGRLFDSGFDARESRRREPLPFVP